MSIATSNGRSGASGSDPLGPRLRRAYLATVYEAGGVSVRVGRRCPAADALLARLGARAGGFVTAWNPRSRRMPPGWNRRMEAALSRHTRRLPSVPARSGTGSWQEMHLFIAADERRLVRLARRFRQHAIVTIRAGRPAHLMLLG